MSNYTVYHCHDYYSNPIAGVDSVVSPKQYVDKAKEMGFRAFGFSNHGNIYNWIEHKDLIEAAGMKYIHACEIYVTFDHGDIGENGNPVKNRDNFHLVAVAKNWDGVRELNALVSGAFNRADDRHFYYMPRVTFEELQNVSNNLIFTTACIASPLGVKSTDESRAKLIDFLVAHKENCYLEIQHHCCEKQRAYNRYIIDLSKELGIPLIAGTDTHSIDEETEKARALMQRAVSVHYEDEDEFNLRLLSYDELCAEYKRQGVCSEEMYLDAIEATNRLADRVESFSLDKTFKYPHITDRAEELLWQKIVDAFHAHPYASKRYTWAEVEPRCREEFSVMKDIGAIDFMYLQSFVRDWEKAHGVHTGFGRGSVGGSFVAYILGITDVDSIKYNLSFSRFMSKERVNLSDIDTDYDEASREITRDFLMNQHLGLDNMESSEIVTFSTLGNRKAIEYLGKGLGLSLDEVREIKSNLLPEDEIPEELEQKYPELFHYVEIVRGMVITTSSHASGHVVTDRKIAEELGICSNGGDPYPVCCQEMSILDKYNWVKFDLLGLRTLEHINLCAEYAGLPYLTPDSEIIGDLRDPNVYASLQKNTSMIFQYESDMAYAFVKRFFSPTTIDNIKNRLGYVDYARMGAIATAALRPAGTSYRDEICSGNFVDYDLKPMRDFLDPTFGRLIFQETITGFLVEFCGYSSGKADVIRRLVAKKHPEDLEKVLPEITEGFCRVMGERYQLTRDEAEAAIQPFIQTIIDASSYAFNEAHSIAYHGISYISAWERLYYPVEWACAGLNAYSGYAKQTTSITNWCKSNGINIKPIRFGESRDGYSYNKELREIYKSAASIKHMNSAVAEELYALSQREFSSFVDLLYSIRKETSCNSRQLEILIRLGYFNDFGETNALLQIFDVFQSYYKTDHTYSRHKNLKKEKMERNGILDVVRQFAEKETEKTLMQVDLQGLLEFMEGNFKKHCQPRKMRDIIEDQKEYLGYIDIQDPKYQGVAYVEELASTKFSPRMRLFSLKNGTVLDCKTWQSVYKKAPLQQGDFIKIMGGKWQARWICVDPEMKTFKKDPTITEFWITSYRKVENL